MKPRATPRPKAPALNASGLDTVEQDRVAWFIALPALAGLAMLGSYLLADFFAR